MKTDIKKQFFTTLSDINISNISFFLHKQRKKGSRNYPRPLKKQEPFKENQEPFKRSPKPFNKRFQEPFKENQEPFKKNSPKPFNKRFQGTFFKTLFCN